MFLSFVVLLLWLPPLNQQPNVREVPGLGKVTLPDGEWELEESHTPDQGAHAFVFKRKAEFVERITIIRFVKRQQDQEMRLANSYFYCDCLADNVAEGLPSLWGVERKRSGDDTKELKIGHMIRLPAKKDREPLAVTNIYSDYDGTNWMNHGLIASDKKSVFLFVHSSTRILSPDVIEEVYLSSRLKAWPVPSGNSK